MMKAGHAPPETIDDIWRDDLFDRRSDAEFLIDFVVSRTAGPRKSFVLNINSGWGNGKTFFLERLQKTLESRGFVAAYINTWEDDYADDPLLPIVDAIAKAIVSKDSGTKTRQRVRAVARAGAKIVLVAAKGAVGQFADKYLGREFVELWGGLGKDFEGAANSAVHGAEAELSKLYDVGSNAILEKFNSAKLSVDNFKSRLSDAISSNEFERPVFVLIDELDRCRPTYAVSLLERVKHLFYVDNIVFILATDTGQLRHSICALYGNSFDSGRYLNRFFDQTFHFEEPKRADLVKATLDEVSRSRLKAPPTESPEDYLGRAFDWIQFGLRDIQQCLQILGNCLVYWPKDLPLILPVIAPLIVAQHRRLNADFESVRKIDGTEINSWAEFKTRIRDFNSTISTTKGWDLFAKFVNEAQRETLVQLQEKDFGGGRIGQWVSESFRHEFQVRCKGGGWRADDERKSVIMKYPELVRSAGRLTHELEKD